MHLPFTWMHRGSDWTRRTLCHRRRSHACRLAFPDRGVRSYNRGRTAMGRSLPSERCFGRSGRRRRGLVKLEGRLSSKQNFSEQYLPRLEPGDGLEVGRQMILHEMPLEELSVQLGSGGEDDCKEEIDTRSHSPWEFQRFCGSGRRERSTVGARSRPCSPRLASVRSTDTARTAYSSPVKSTAHERAFNAVSQSAAEVSAI